MNNPPNRPVIFRVCGYASGPRMVDAEPAQEVLVWRVTPPLPSGAGRVPNLAPFAAGTEKPDNALSDTPATESWEAHPEELMQLFDGERCLHTGIAEIPRLPYVPLAGQGDAALLRFEWSESAPHTPPHLVGVLENRREYYRRLVGHNPQLNLYDGPLVRVVAVERTPDRTLFFVCLGSYFDGLISAAETDRAFASPIVLQGRMISRPRDLVRVPTEPHAAAHRLAEPVESGLTHPMGVAAVALTRDNYLVFGLRNDRVSTFRNLIGPPVCGVVANVDDFRTRARGPLVLLVQKEIVREAVEELHLPSASAIAAVNFLGLARELNRGGSYQFFFSIELLLDFPELADLLTGHPNDEYSRFYGVKLPGGHDRRAAICTALIGQTTLDDRIIGTELKANVAYFKEPEFSVKSGTK